MEQEKIIILLDNTANQPSKFRIRNWVETNDDSSSIKFKTSMMRWHLYYCSDAYILVSETITITGVGDERKKQSKEVKELFLKIVHHLITVYVV